MKPIITPFFTLLSLLITACSPVKVLNSLIPTQGYMIERDVSYSALPRQKLDIYLPQSKTSGARPVILFFYGGSWDSGEKADYLFVAEAFASLGYIVVIPDYRVYPEVKFPDFMQDPATAAHWTKSHIAQYGGDPNRIFIMGHSAGAHLAVMLALNPSYLTKVGEQPKNFCGFIGLAGPYDFLPLKSKRLREIFGTAEMQQQSQPIHYVTGDNPPLLLLVGLKDGTVWPRNSINLAKAIHEHHGPVKLIEFANYGHIDMVAKLAKPLRGNSDLLNAITAFMQKICSTSPP